MKHAPLKKESPGMADVGDLSIRWAVLPYIFLPIYWPLQLG